MKKIVLSESSYDYKYQNIFSRIPDVKVIDGKFIKLLKTLARKKSYYHIRYIIYRGPILTFLRILLVFFLSKISGSKIIWSCHNIYEHNIPSIKYNKIILYFLSYISFKIVVFHTDLKEYLPNFAHQKVLVASFGEFKSFIEQRNKINPQFWKEYQDWLKRQKISSPDLIAISAAKRNDLRNLIKEINETDLNSVFIVPNFKLPNYTINRNILIFNNDFVEKEIKDILNNHKNLVGIVSHNNISVPTSLYMFASYDIPIIGKDIQPVNSIIKKYSLGEIYDDGTYLKDLIEKIVCNYESYKKGCRRFISENNWDNSAAIHKVIFE